MYIDFLDFRNKVIAKSKRYCKKGDLDTSCLVEENWQGFHDDPSLFRMAVETVVNSTNGNEW
jgi:hypothetical protein